MIFIMIVAQSLKNYALYILKRRVILIVLITILVSGYMLYIIPGPQRDVNSLLYIF
jgi:hypothetical protein